MGLGDIRVFCKNRHWLAHNLEHSLAMHSGQSKGAVIEMYTHTIESCRDELDRLHEVEHEHKAMLAEQNADRRAGDPQ